MMINMFLFRYGIVFFLLALNIHFLLTLHRRFFFCFHIFVTLQQQQADHTALSQRLSEQLVAQILSSVQNMALATTGHAHQTARRWLRLGRLECANRSTTSGTHDYTGVSGHEFDPGRVATNAANFARRVQSRT
jgi:hypothetical protein